MTASQSHKGVEYWTKRISNQEMPALCSTVSRAAVVLGFDTIRNICLTARLLSSLLESHNLSDSVFKRLLKLMVQSFHAAMIARMMVSDRDEALREEVFIATFLYRIGESAF